MYTYKNDHYLTYLFPLLLLGLPPAVYNRRGKIFYLIGEQECWGRGLTTEAVSLMLDYAFQEIDLHRIYTEVFPPNIASIRILEKLGITLEGILREYSYFDGKFQDAKQYSILKNEWLNREPE